MKTKHGIGNDAECRGMINLNGVCKLCHEYAPGVQSYCIKMVVADPDNDEVQHRIESCSDACGLSLFNMDATAFDALTTTERKAAIDKILYVPHLCSALLKPKFEKGVVDAYLYNFKLIG